MRLGYNIGELGRTNKEETFLQAKRQRWIQERIEKRAGENKSRIDPSNNSFQTSKGTDKDPKGKGKNKEGRVQRDHRNLCANFQVDQCLRANCPYVHETGTAAEQAELEKLRNAIAAARSRSASPAPGTRICYEFQNTGTCKHGNRCRYSNLMAKGKGHGKKGKKGKE